MDSASGNMTFFLYLAIMVLITYAVRAVPFALTGGRIRNPHIRAFLDYIPYAVLTSMTVPMGLFATGSIISAAAGLAISVILALRKKSLTEVAVAACITVFIAELILKHIGSGL